jgi:hypothetical protein
MQIYTDTDTQEKLTERDVKKRFAPTIVNDINGVDLASVGVAQVEFIETPAPTVEPWQTLEAGPIEKTETTWTTTWNVIEPTLEQAQTYKSSEIMARYEADKLTPVTTDGADWKGGFSSAQGIDSVTRMAEERGDTSVTLYDVTGASHVKTIAEAKAITLAIGDAYQVVYGKMATKLNAVATATTVSDVLAVSWDD